MTSSVPAFICGQFYDAAVGAGADANACDAGAGWRVISRECDGADAGIRVYKTGGGSGTGPGPLLCYFKARAISSELSELAVDSYLAAGKQVSTNRGTAAGSVHRKIKANFEKGVPANSAIVGYIDSPNHKRPCRLTMYSQKYHEKYSAGLPFIHAIDACMQEAVPERYAKQAAVANVATDFCIKGTAFSTVTVNYNFRTALHRDSGDYKDGFGTLVVCNKDVRGGHLLFPEHKVAIKMETGDFLAMDVHELHCNSPIELLAADGYRLSFVCYLREKIVNCSAINRTLDVLGVSGAGAPVKAGGNWDTELIFREIFGGGDGDAGPLPEKRALGADGAGTKWWMMRDSRFCLTYKNKRYELYDSVANQKIHNLMPAWTYVRNLRAAGARECDIGA